MNIKIKSIHFDATEKLEAFIDKKISKLEKNAESATSAEVTLKVVKPETVKNKETQIRVVVPDGELFASKTCNTFEEGVDQCIDAISKQWKKYKEKQQQK